jgi:hypothetical protein
MCPVRTILRYTSKAGSEREDRSIETEKKRPDRKDEGMKKIAHTAEDT